MPKTIEVQLDDRVITVSKLPLKKYSELIGVVEDMPKTLASFGNLSQENIISQLPQIISKSLPEFIKVVSIAIDMPKEEVELLGMTEFVKIVTALFEVNDYSELFETVKKVMARNPKVNSPSA